MLLHSWLNKLIDGLSNIHTVLLILQAIDIMTVAEVLALHARKEPAATPYNYVLWQT